jgi:putative transposase
MPRPPRLDIAGLPQHVTQRGHDQQPCFFSEADYRCYLTHLVEASRRFDCTIHTFVLMTNHVHLLVTPLLAGSLARMMQLLGRRYVSYINGTYRRSGTLWEGRYKACLVDTDDYLLTCYRYIELNPVRAAMVDDPSRYPWSSYHVNALGHSSTLIQPHPQYLALGDTPIARQAAYRELFGTAISEDRLAEIRAYLRQQKALGSPKFQAHIESMLNRCAQIRPAHRPRKDYELQ